MVGPVSRGIYARVLGLVLGCGLLGVVGLVATGGPAQAQLNCAPNATFQVDTAAEFNEAIECHNSETADITITLTADIVADEIADTRSVFTRIRGEGLVIEGAGFTVRRGSAAGTEPLAVLGVIDPIGAVAPAQLIDFDFPATRITDLHVAIGPHDTAGILHSSPGALLIRTSSVAGEPGSTATGVISWGTGTFALEESFVEQVAFGVNLSGRGAAVVESTIHSTAVDFRSPDALGANVILNSTLAGPVGVELGASDTYVENTTVLGDGELLPQDFDAIGSVIFKSSIVNTCSSDLLLGPFRFDAGGNAGSCFDFGTREPVPGLTLDTFECVRPTPRGCAPTASIDPTSPAVSVGDCREFSTGHPVETDQRGEPRTPAGLSCDAGSYESPFSTLQCVAPPIVGNATYRVSTGKDFNDAIACFNAATDTFTPVVIELRADIEATTLGGNSVFSEITRTTSALIIEGNGFALRRGPDAPTTAAPLVSTSATSDFNLRLNDLRIDIGPSDTHALLVQGSGDVDMQRSAIVATPGSTATGITVDRTDDSTIGMHRSTIDGARVGLQARGGFVTAVKTTFTSTEIDVLSDGAVWTSVANSTLTAPLGMQIGSGVHYIAYSTVLGDGAAIADGTTGTVTFLSSVIGSCSLSNAIDEGGNAGGCFDATQVIDTELADNGCDEQTPTGCPKTIALRPDSPARGAGDCTETPNGLVDVDQRDRPRTPVGPGCDAGAFEAECVPELVTMVTTENEFDEAIRCYNSLESVTGDFTIALENDLAFEVRGRVLSLALSIDQRQPGSTLTIEGQGNQLGDVPTADAPFPLTASVLRMSETNVAPVTFRNLQMQINLPFLDGEMPAISNDSAATMTIESSAIMSRSETAVRSNAGALTSVIDSWISAEFAAVRSVGSFSSVNSTLTSNSAFQGSLVVLGPGEIDITNSTFIGAGIIANNAIMGTIRSSTSEGFGVGGNSPVRLESSIATSCSSTVLATNRANAGGCVGVPIDLPPPADNGCAVQTPAGCPPTFAIPADSPAVGIGDCTGVPTDQRGEPRRIAGPGCDAGSFETLLAAGDVDADGAVTNADVQALLDWLAGGIGPVGLDSGDLNDDGVVKLDDAMAIAQLVAG